MSYRHKAIGPLPYVICGLAALFYLYEFFLRVIPSAITQELMQNFHIGARGLGIMSALFFYGYTPMQLPVGMLYDRLGPRRLLTLSIGVCALATLMFALTHSLYIAYFARFLMGFAAAFAYIGALVLATRWFPPQYFSIVVGLIQLLGCLGAVFGEGPFAYVAHHSGWRTTVLATALAGVVLTILYWLIIRDHPRGYQNIMKPTHKLRDSSNLKVVLGNKQTWTVGLYAFSCWAPISIFATLWGPPFLMSLYHMSNTAATSAVMLVWIGLGIGSPLVCWYSESIKRRKRPLLFSSIISLVTSIFILYVPHIPINLMYVLLFFYGSAAGSQAVSFALTTENNPLSAAGTAIGFNNMAIVSGGLILLPLVGFILHELWNGVVVNGIPVYTLHNYQTALISIPVCASIGIIVSLFFLKETYCKHQVRPHHHLQSKSQTVQVRPG